jgi:hypothetical protein
MTELGAATELRHDLFTTFNHVVGYCELLLEEADDELAEPIRRQLAVIARAGRDGIAAVKAVLTPENLAGGGVDRLALVGALEGPLNSIERRSRELMAVAESEGRDDLLADLDRIRRAAERARALA